MLLWLSHGSNQTVGVQGQSGVNIHAEDGDIIILSSNPLHPLVGPLDLAFPPPAFWRCIVDVAKIMGKRRRSSPNSSVEPLF